MAKNGKKIIQSSPIIIILFFSDKNYKNIVYLSLKAMRWFTIGGTSPLPGLAIGRSEMKVIVYYFVLNSNNYIILSIKIYNLLMSLSI